MSILNLLRVEVGQVGVLPSTVKMCTTDNFATITGAGYLTNSMLVGGFKPTDVLEVIYSYSQSDGTGTFGTFTLSITSGVITLTPSAGYRIISGTTAAYGGGGTSNAFTVTGLTVNSKGSAVIRASTNAVSIAKALPGTDTLTITFSADPGAATTVDYIYTTVAAA
jgi:hypothetical protein